MALLFCIMGFSVCLVLVNFEFIMTEQKAAGRQTLQPGTPVPCTIRKVTGIHRKRQKRERYHYG